MKRTEKAIVRGRGHGPRDSDAVQTPPEVPRAPVPSQPEAPGPAPVGPTARIEPSIPSEVLDQALAAVGLDAAQIRRVRWDEERRVLTVTTHDFAIREVIVSREMSS